MSRARSYFAATAVLLPVAAALALPGSASAGGWTQPARSYYVKVWDRSLVSPGEGAAFDTQGDTIGELSGFQDHQLNLYAEYGLIDSVTLIGFSTPIGWAKFGSASGAYIGPTGIGARVRLLDRVLKLAAQGQYSYAPPVGDDAVSSETAGPIAAPITIAYVPTVSTHAGEMQLQAGYGTSWGWLTGSAGFRANSEASVGHALTGFAQLGVSRIRRVTLDVHLNLYESINPIQTVNLAGTGRTSYLGIGVGAGYALTDRVSLVASVEGVAYAKSNAAAPSLALGLELRPKQE